MSAGSWLWKFCVIHVVITVYEGQPHNLETYYISYLLYLSDSLSYNKWLEYNL